ncbi:phosphotransferase [Streptomyces brasiliensis]|uniref:phosphotransferase n=1 Tax=Streptomyces brasiliensis TaxID=1954 RepID=UPI001E46D136|nr:phosphotransferase [Streptomyces brasiliensis]
MPADAAVLHRLTAKVTATAHPTGATCACPAPATQTLTHRPDATVVRHTNTVAKAHAPGTDPTELTLRLTTAARLPDILLAPLATIPAALEDRLVTFWPYGIPVNPDDPDAAPWEAAATLLAHLHRTPLPTTSRFLLPPMRGPRKAARAIARLRAALDTTCTPAAPPVLAAWCALPAWARAEAPMTGGSTTGGPTTLCHGDLHLGQLVRHPAPHGPWRLIDVDDLGPGVPAWDLARPAAWYACGLLPPDEWARFLEAYRTAEGPAVPRTGDPWPALDIPARALTVQTAALALVKALAADRPLDEVEQALVDACARMSSASPELTNGFPK